jgi:hypothetical protein
MNSREEVSTVEVRRGLALGISCICAIGVVDTFLVAKTHNSHVALSLVLLSLIPTGLLAAYVTPKGIATRGASRKFEASDTESAFLTAGFLMCALASVVSTVVLSSPYHRSPIYFLFIGLAVTFLSMMIITRRVYTRSTFLVTFAGILLVGIILRLTSISLITGFFGDDPLSHQAFVNQIVSTHRIPNEGAYADFPLMHIQIAATMGLSSLGFKSSATVAITLVQATVWPLITFMIVRRINLDIRLAFLSALILNSSDVVIWYATLGAFPTTFAVTFVLLISYLLLKVKTTNRGLVLLLFVLMTITVTFSHSMTALIMIIVVFVFAALGVLHGNRERTALSRLRFTTSCLAISTIFVFAYWMCVAGFVFSRFVNVLLTNEGVFASFVTIGGRAYSQQVPLLDYFMNMVGQFIVYGFAVIGFVAWISASERRRGPHSIPTMALGFLLIGGFGQVLSLGVGPDRWLYYAYMFLPVVASLGILLLSDRLLSLTHKKVTSVAIAMIIFTASFLVISDSHSNNDSPFYGQDLVAPRFLKDSEIASATNLVSLCNSSIGSDNDLASYLRFTSSSSSAAVPIDFYSKGFDDFTGVIILRDSFFHQPIYSRGLYKLNYDLLAYLDQNRLNRIYDSGTIIGFCTSGE